jgi:hypothetical protein
MAMIEQPTFSRADQWQVQVLARVLLKAQVYVLADGLSEAQLALAHMAKIEDVERAVQEALLAQNGSSRVCYLPEGPQTIPYVV